MAFDMGLLNKIQGEEGQATVEAAIMIPVIFLLILMLLEPGILLYDRCVMSEAAAEGCRVLATSSSSNIDTLVKPLVHRRLGAIPQQDNFHVHSTGCSYSVETSGDQNSANVSVTVKTEVKPLPLIGFLSGILGILNDSKNFVVEVTANQKSRPDWTESTPAGSDVEKWVGAWL